MFKKNVRKQTTSRILKFAILSKKKNLIANLKKIYII